MRNVAIVEDDKGASEKLKELLDQFGREKGEDFQYFVFTSAEVFLTNYKAFYDVVFMDIELPGLNGMEAARKLRALDKDVVLVFVTNMAQFAVGGYEVGAFDFILKPITYARFYLKFVRIMQKIRTSDETQIVIKGKQFTRCVSASTIKYVEVQNHALIYHTTDGDIIGGGSMKEAARLLADKNFALCNQSYLVNLKYVREFSKTSVLVGEDWLLISRPKKQEFMNAVQSYLNGGGRE